MELLGIGPLELIAILVIALIIFSPKDIAKGGKAAGRWINQLYRSETWKSMRQVSQEMQNLPSRLAREAQLDELRELENEIKSDLVSPQPGRSPANPTPPAAQIRGPETIPPATADSQANTSPTTKNDE